VVLRAFVFPNRKDGIVRGPCVRFGNTRMALCGGGRS